ncbi:hypothetical protein H8B09_28700 [Paenibacillus sp. PR3]|uniref:Lipoprotein n=1 Tax=Paenibacillus terricola TaxID=2763503 RepID=A0ABR8N3J2_9BACL|nr:hypothetical protein [Paenibacillus terricola]MBD3922723.1 hypothetical protein [Paenibacillus terricola]
MKKWLLAIFLLSLTIGLAACQSDSSDQTREEQQEGSIPSSTEDQQAEMVNESRDEIVITDIATWTHPVKSILSGVPFELHKVILTNESTYPKFYVQYPDVEALKTSQDLPDKLLAIAKENGYWDYELVNEQGKLTIEVKIDKKAKRIKSILVNGEPYSVPDAVNQDAGSSADGEAKVPESIVVPKKYAAFVEEHSLGSLDDVNFFKTVDLNGDGIEEAVIAFSDVYKIYVLGENNSEVKQLGDSLQSAYGVYNIRFIHLQDRPEPVIAFGLSNGGGLDGFWLIGLQGEKLEEISYSASATGAGVDELIDADQDGKYDGYVQERYSYDVMYYHVLRTFELRNHEFVQTRTSVDLGKYPAEARDVIAQYITLHVLDDGYSPELTQRLAELCPSCTEDQLLRFEHQWKTFKDFDTFSLHELLMDNESMIEQVDPKMNVKTIILTESMDNGIDGKLTVRLEKTKDRWVIIDF